MLIFFFEEILSFWKQSPISTKLREIPRSLIENQMSDFRILKWRIHYGGRQIESPINFSATLYSAIFEVADYKSEVRYKKF